MQTIKMGENSGVSLIVGENVQKRTRVSNKRSRNGCSTCRIRRIKCDEHRLRCGQCIRGLRKCENYFSSRLLSQERHVGTSSDTHSPLKTLTEIQSSGNITSKERRSLYFFHHHTVPQLCGSFPSSFWSSFVLQAAHQEPAISHAVIALGAVHERFETKFESPCDLPNQFAVEQYGKAIKLIFNQIDSKRKLRSDVTLIACVLFICIEIILGHHGTAISHISSGAKILLEEKRKEMNPIQQSSQFDLDSASLTYVPLSTLSLVFLRLDIQASQILSHRPLYLREEFTDRNNCFHSHIPTDFANLEEARNAMDYIRSCVMRSLESITQAESILLSSAQGQDISEVDIDRKTCAIRLTRWSTSFGRFLREHEKKLDDIQQQGVRLLKIQMIMAQMNLEIEDLDVKWTETAYDSYALEFKAIISHATVIVKSQAPSRGSFRFSLDPGFVPALYFVASKCRHSDIRRKAISLLGASGRQEGVWDSKPVVKVLERFVEIEEEGLGELTDAFDVPDCNRLSGIDARFDLEGRRAFVRYQRIWGPGVITKRDLREMIEW